MISRQLAADPRRRPSRSGPPRQSARARTRRGPPSAAGRRARARAAAPRFPGPSPAPAAVAGDPKSWAAAATVRSSETADARLCCSPGSARCPAAARASAPPSARGRRRERCDVTTGCLSDPASRHCDRVPLRRLRCTRPVTFRRPRPPPIARRRHKAPPPRVCSPVKLRRRRRERRSPTPTPRAAPAAPFSGAVAAALVPAAEDGHVARGVHDPPSAACANPERARRARRRRAPGDARVDQIVQLGRCEIQYVSSPTAKARHLRASLVDDSSVSPSKSSRSFRPRPGVLRLALGPPRVRLALLPVRVLSGPFVLAARGRGRGGWTRRTSARTCASRRSQFCAFVLVGSRGSIWGRADQIFEKTAGTPRALAGDGLSALPFPWGTRKRSRFGRTPRRRSSCLVEARASVTFASRDRLGRVLGVGGRTKDQRDEGARRERSRCSRARIASRNGSTAVPAAADAASITVSRPAPAPVELSARRHRSEPFGNAACLVLLGRRRLPPPPPSTPTPAPPPAGR